MNYITLIKPKEIHRKELTSSILATIAFILFVAVVGGLGGFAKP